MIEVADAGPSASDNAPAVVPATDAPAASPLDVLLSTTMSSSRFLAEHWEQSALHLQREDPTLFGGVLQLHDMDEVLCRAQLPDTAAELLIFRCTRSRKKISPGFKVTFFPQ